MRYRFQACNQSSYDRSAKFFKDWIMLAKEPKNCLPSTAQFKRKRRGMMGWREPTEDRIGRGAVYRHKCVQTQCYADRWQLNTLASRRKTKDAHRRQDANNGSDTDLKRTHQHIHTHTYTHACTHQPEQLYPQRAGGEINAC